MSEKKDSTRKRKRGGKVRKVRVKLMPDAAEEVRSEETLSLGHSRIDKILENFGLLKAVHPRISKFGHLTGMRSRWITLEFPSDVDFDALLDALVKDPDIEAAESVKDIIFTVTPNDPQLAQQWHLATIEAEDAWDNSIGNNIRIGVVDSGVDRNHNDLTNHWDGGDNNWNGGHGTQMAGICGADTDNNLGIAGVGWNAHILGYEQGDTAEASDDIEDAVDDGASVINMSWIIGGPSSSEDVKDALKYAFRRGVVCVSSAGNADFAIPYTAYPAAYRKLAIAVGATDNNDVRAAFSNYGSWLDVMAPGVNIRTTDLGNGYVAVSGTSPATAVVSGIAALMVSRNRTLGPRQVAEILTETTEIPAGTDTSNNRYGKGRVNARKALLASEALWKTVRYSRDPGVGAATAISDSGWWIVAYSKSVFVGYKNYFWRKMVYYNSVPYAEPDVDINENGDWIVNYSKSTFVGYRTSYATKMVYYPRRRTRGSVAINENGDWIAAYSLSTFVGHKTSSARKMIYYNNVPGVPGDVAINENGDWICCYSKSTFVGYKTSYASKMVYYDRVANAASAVDINDNGDWIVNYSKSTFVGNKTSSSHKMVYYSRRNIPGSVAINKNGYWICCYSKSTFVGYKTSYGTKMVYYDRVADAASAVDINDNGDWIVNYSRSTFVGYKTSSSRKMVYYPRRNVPGDVAINSNGDWIAVYSLSTFIGHKTSWSSKRVYYDNVPRARGSVDINDNGDWIVNYSRTTFVGQMTQSTVKAVKYAPDDMSRSDISDGYSYPPSTLPSCHGAVGINSEGDWVACYSRSAHTGTRQLYTNTHRF
ncbi:MAG: S8 family serine peptidase [Candidatus Thorarchaeota archaeon]|jgi:hypothetical protein